MSRNSGSEQDVRHHYTLVCQCEWSEDEFTRTVESRNCVIHGDEPDPLYALLAENEQLRADLGIIAGPRTLTIDKAKRIARDALEERG